MCQLIEVTWFIWKLSTDQLIVLLDRNQCSISYFLASLGAQENYNAHILGINVAINWQMSKQSIRWPVSLDRIAGSGVNPSRSSIFEVIRWQVTSFQMIAGSSLIFFNWCEICCVYVPHNKNFDFKLTSYAKIQPAITCREDGRFWLCSQWSRVGHARRPCLSLIG